MLSRRPKKESKDKSEIRKEFAESFTIIFAEKMFKVVPHCLY